MYKVLLIDDSRSDRSLLLGNMPANVFKEAEFIEADSLETASKFLGYRHFDIAVLDLFGVCPGKDGVETYYEFRKQFPGLPTLILTGSEDEGLARVLVENGADGYVVKGSMQPQQFYRELFNCMMIARHRPRMPDAAAIAQRVSSSSQELQKVSVSSVGDSDAVRTSLCEALAANGELGLVLLQKFNEQAVENAARAERMSALISDVKELKSRAFRAQDLLIEERQSHVELTRAERMAALSLQEISTKNRWKFIMKVTGLVLAPTTGIVYLIWQWYAQKH